MANRATYDLSNKTIRAKLRIRRKPYYASLAPKLTLGWVRQSKSEAGRWIVRTEVGRATAGHPLYRQRTIGLADDLATADGRHIFTHQQAARLAADRNAIVSDCGPLTLSHAVEQYGANLGTRSKHAVADRSRLLRHLPPELLATPITRLNKTALENWRDSLVRNTNGDPDLNRRSKDTANRVLSILKAALNRSLEDENSGVDDDRAWRLVKPFKNVGRAREVHFSEAEVVQWIKAARAMDPSLSDLIEAGFHTGARLGELLACDVRQFDAKRAQLHIPRGKTGERHVLLPAEANRFFIRVAAGRPKEAPLLPNAAGERWTKNTHSRPIKASLRAAKLDARASFYALRHTNASRRIERGQHLLLIAQELGTSVKMLEQTYGKFLKESRRQLIEDAAPSLLATRRVKRGA